MTLRAATILSAREWESDLVAHTRETASLRLVLRAFQPGDIEARADDIDVVIAGAEVAWVTPTQIRSWRRRGLTVLGIYPTGDRPAADLMANAGADEVLPDDTSPDEMVRAIQFLRPGPERSQTERRGITVAVLGPRGAPGRTEIALALAWNWASHGRVLLMDLDLEGPALAVRLGLPPRPDITDAADAVRAVGDIPSETVHDVDGFACMVGSHRRDEPPLRQHMVEDVVEAAVAGRDVVLLDLGQAAPDDKLLKRADEAVLVVDASAVGIVRAARLISRWSGPPPRLVVNRIGRAARGDVINAARQWTGLEPEVVVPERPAIRDSALAAKPPHRVLRRALGSMHCPV